MVFNLSRNIVFVAKEQSNFIKWQNGFLLIDGWFFRG